MVDEQSLQANAVIRSVELKSAWFSDFGYAQPSSHQGLSISTSLKVSDKP